MHDRNEIPTVTPTGWAGGWVGESGWRTKHSLSYGSNYWFQFEDPVCSVRVLAIYVDDLLQHKVVHDN